MRTSKPFSTISYNTKDYLVYKLDLLVKLRVIYFYAFIVHYAEADEKKNHIHLYVCPNGMFDTEKLYKELLEVDVSSELPLAIMPCQSSKFADWYLYTCHNVDYLKSKGLERKYHYIFSDFITSNTDYFNELVHTIPINNNDKVRLFVDKVLNGKSLNQMLLDGEIAVGQFTQYKSMYDYLKGCKD